MRAQATQLPLEVDLLLSKRNELVATAASEIFGPRFAKPSLFVFRYVAHSVIFYACVSKGYKFFLTLLPNTGNLRQTAENYLHTIHSFQIKPPFVERFM